MSIKLFHASLTEIVKTDQHDSQIMIKVKHNISPLRVKRLRMANIPLNQFSHDRYKCILNFERLLHHFSLGGEQWR